MSSSSHSPSRFHSSPPPPPRAKAQWYSLRLPQHSYCPSSICDGKQGREKRRLLYGPRNVYKKLALIWVRPTYVQCIC
ncbi:hypothetical protein I3842_13G097400 [Carya illinoinensis]|uniref:Uncharacterized protein n=1 Tax=Carya illinoinensis TaxID=32201 RepID=A0A922ALG3_CARIL|nr:hypothetical protein I3842_13G097400 [Carya illinoinensis]